MTALSFRMRHPLATLMALLAMMLVASSAVAQDFPPRPDGPIYDGADILSTQTETELGVRLRAYNKLTGRAIVVATVPSLEGESIEPYATNLFETWGIGGEKRDQGLLLLIAKEDREMRIEIGYGLHPYFGGIMAGRVIRDTITPRFKSGDFDGGVTAGIDRIITHLDRSPRDAIAIEEAAEASRSRGSAGSDGGFPIGLLIWGAFVFFFFILPMIRGGSRRRYGRGVGGAVGDIILWEAGKAVARGVSGGRSSGGFGKLWRWRRFFWRRRIWRVRRRHVRRRRRIGGLVDYGISHRRTARDCN